MHIGRLPELNITGNSTYIPIEYSVVNCPPVDCWIVGVILSGPSEIELNGTIANANITATPILPTEYCSPNYSFYVDNQFITNNTSGDLSLQFANVGQFNVEVTVLCGYCPLSGGQSFDSIDINVKCKKPSTSVPLATDKVTFNPVQVSPPADAQNIKWGEFALRPNSSTSFDYNKIFSIDIAPYFDEANNSWKAKVISANAEYYMWWRLLPPRPNSNPVLDRPEAVKEATISDSTPTTCEQILRDLKSYDRYSYWYKVDGVEAHERVHGDDWAFVLNTMLPIAKVPIEALSIPHTCGMTATQAKEKIKSLTKYSAAITLALQTALEVSIASYSGHQTTTITDAEFEQVKPLIDTINIKAALEQDENVIWPASCKF